MITAEDVRKIREQAATPQQNKGKVTADMVANIRKQMQPTTQQPIMQEQVPITQPVVEPTPQAVTQPVQQPIRGTTNQQTTTLPNSLNIKSNIVQQANNAMPSFKTFQTQFNEGKKEAQKEIEQKGDEFKGRDIENYDKLLKQATAEHNTKNKIKYENLKEEAEKQVKEKAKTASADDYDLDFTSQSNNINMLGNEVQRNAKLYEDMTNLGASQEELNKIASNYQTALNEYNEALNKYYDNQYYDKYKNNNMFRDIAESFGKNVLGGTATPINFGTAATSKLIGNDATSINAEQLLQYNNGKGFNGKDVERILDKIIPSPMSIINNATGRNEGPATAYAHLALLAQTHPNSRKLQNLLSAISNHSYTGTAEDLKKDLDEAQKEMYQDFKNRTTQDDLNRVAEQTAHNERAYENMAWIPNAFGTVGNMVPSMLVGGAAGGIAELAGGGSMAVAGTAANTLQRVGSLGTLGLGAGGSAMDEAIRNGATYNQAMEYGALKGATEAGTEVLGGETVNRAFGQVGESVLGKVFGKAIGKLNIKSAIGKKLAKIGTDIAGEMTEEMIAEAVDPLWRQLTYDNGAIKDYGTIDQWKNVFKAGLEAIPSTLIMQGGNVVLNKTSQLENGIIKSIQASDNLSQESKQALIQQVQEASKQMVQEINEQEQNNQIARENVTIANQVAELNKKGFNIPQSTANTLQAIQDVRGTRIEFDDTIDGNGVYDAKNRTIYLNPTQHARAIEFTIAHELGHDIKAGNLEDYNKLQKAVLDYAGKQQGFTEGMKALDNTYRSKLGEGNYDINDEMTNDILGEVLGNQEFLDSLAQKQPNLFQKVWNWIKNVLIDNTNGRLSFEERRMLNKYEQGFRNAYQKAFNGTQQEETQQSLSEDDKTLATTHNLDEDKLLGLFELGGIPAPSLAISDVRKLTPTQFGEGTLLFNKETIDPENRLNEVYDRDIYSKRFPTIEYNVNVDKLKKEVLDNKKVDYLDPIESHFATNYLTDNLSSLIDSVGLEKALKEIKNNDEAKYFYLKHHDNTFSPEYTGKDYTYFTSEFSNNEVKKFLDEYNGKPLNELSNEEEMTLGDKIADIILDSYKPEIEKISQDKQYEGKFKDSLLNFYKEISDKYKNQFNKIDMFINSAVRMQMDGNDSQTIDKEKTLEKAKENINQQEFENWVDQTFGKAFNSAEKGIRNNKDAVTDTGRRTWKQLHDKYNLENVVKYMKKGDTKGTEGNMFTKSFGTTQAVAANRFNSIEEIRSAKNRLTTPEEANAKLEPIKEKLDKNITELADYGTTDENWFGISLGQWPKAAEAIEEFAKGKSLTIASLKKTLSNYRNFKNVNIPNEVLQGIVDTIKELKEIYTDYFEAKPQRAVNFDEINKALIPKNWSDKTKQGLKERDIEYIEYDPEVEGDREAKYREAAQDVLFSKQNNTWQQFLDNTYGKWNTGTRTNFEQLPSNEELQQAERDSVAEDAKALNLEKQPKRKKLTQQERDANIQAEIEKRVLEAVGNNFDKETLLKRLQEASKEADNKSNIESKTQTDEDNITANRRIRTILDDFIHDIRRGKDIRQNQVYMKFSNPNYEIKEGNVYVEQNKMTSNTSLGDMRDFKGVGNRKINAYQYDNPEVKPFFQHEARNMLQDLNNAVKGEKSATWNDYGELRYTGTSRETTQDIADLLDGNNGVKLSYEDIRKGLNAIIEDKGSENIAAAKRIEMVLDKRLREGYTDSYGDSYEPNENYLNFLAGKDFIEPAEYERQVAERMATEDGTLFSLSEEQQNEVNDYINKLTNDTTIDDNFKDQILTRFDNLTDYKQFENIKQDVEDYKEKAYQGIKSLVDVANMKPEDVKQRPMEYTQRKDKNTPNQRRFFDNAETSNIIADETKNRVNATTYEQKANLDTLEQVRQKLDERGNDMVEEWKHKTKNFTDKDVALGAILIERYQQAGDWNSAARAIEKLADMGTEAGRAVQMYSIFQRLSPETMALYQQKELDKAFEEMKQRKTGKWVEANQDKYKLTAEDTQFIYEQVEKASQAIDEETKQRELSKIESRINDKLPPEDGQTIKALRRIAMLFNPKTQVRNIVGNTLIMPVNDIADVIGAGIDRIVARKTGTRTTGLPNPITKAKGFAKGVKSAITDYKTGTRTTGSGSKYEFDIGAKPFNENTDSKVKNAINNKLNGINNLLSAVMSGGDRPFYEAAYKNSLESQMKANKVKEPTQDMIDIAVNEALQRTWNDNNEYTKAVLGIRSAMNKINIKGFGLGDLIVPFAKTPANLTKAMVEYSPAGFIPAISNYVDMNRAISRGEMTPQQQKKFVSSMSKAIAGSILYAIAGSLVKAGKITGSADDDKDVRNFEQNVLGIQPYSVRLGDKTYTYSWANPINAPLAIMADSYKMSKEDAKLYDQLYNAVKVAGNVLLDNSFLQGISDIFTHQEGPVAGIIESIMSMPESMIPTFLSQIASLGDDTQRQTYEYKNKGQSVINRVKNKIPGARNTLEPKVNTFGEEIENQNNLFNAFLNPANVREARTTEAQKEIYSLYEATGDKTIFPMQAPNSVTKNGNTENLTNKQKTRYQKGSGQYATEVYGDLFDSDYYDSISNTQKTDLLQRVAQDANKMGKTEVGVWTEDTFKVDERYNELEDRGIPLADYYIAWSAQKDVVSDKDANGKTIQLSASRKKKEAIDDAVDNLNKKQMEYLYGIFDISEKVW